MEAAHCGSLHRPQRPRAISLQVLGLVALFRHLEDGAGSTQAARNLPPRPANTHMQQPPTKLGGQLIEHP